MIKNEMGDLAGKVIHTEKRLTTGEVLGNEKSGHISVIKIYTYRGVSFPLQ